MAFHDVMPYHSIPRRLHGEHVVAEVRQRRDIPVIPEDALHVGAGHDGTGGTSAAWARRAAGNSSVPYWS